MNPIHKILFQIDPERAHQLALSSLKIAYQLNLTHFLKKPISSPRQIMGITFPNSVGLAAGFDKNGDYIDALATLGFGFIEIGTITPKPQAGNAKPRLLRIPEKKAIINRMGFNNKGCDYVVNQLEKTRYQGVLGINIGKNRDTPNEKAIEDYLIGFKKLWKFASYITINVSSPNTPGLRDLQKQKALSLLLGALKSEQKHIFLRSKKYVPLVLKISPDLSSEALTDLINVILEQNIDGIIATNTTLKHPNAASGGLSGAPLSSKSTDVIKQLHPFLQNKIPIIASGGIMDAVSAQEKFQAGASLIQVYSGFIYEGIGLIHRLTEL